jgi:hypothetical protein
MQVRFREVDPFNLWIWAQLQSNASAEQKETLGEVLKAWFILGKLGGFNAMRLQVQRHANTAGVSVSNMRYEVDDSDESAAFFHAMGDCEFKDNWMRCWCGWRHQPRAAGRLGGSAARARARFDLGTSDELALDVLINSLNVFSKECVAACARARKGVRAQLLSAAHPPAAAGTCPSSSSSSAASTPTGRRTCSACASRRTRRRSERPPLGRSCWRRAAPTCATCRLEGAAQRVSISPAQNENSPFRRRRHRAGPGRRGHGPSEPRRAWCQRAACSALRLHVPAPPRVDDMHDRGTGVAGSTRMQDLACARD